MANKNIRSTIIAKVPIPTRIENEEGGGIVRTILNGSQLLHALTINDIIDELGNTNSLITSINGGYNGIATIDSDTTSKDGYWITLEGGIFPNFGSISVGKGYTIIYYSKETSQWLYDTLELDPNVPIPDDIFFDNSLSRSNSLGHAIKVGNTWTNIIDSVINANVNYQAVTTYADGTPMDDSKVDNVVYRKRGNEYLKRVYQGAINVQWFGAKGDGVHDDTKELSRINILIIKFY